jgi:hypothetical protein
VDALAPRVVHRGVVPFHHQPLPFLRREQRQFADAARRIGDDSLEQPHEMACHPLDRGDVEQVARVLKVARQLAAAFGQVQREVELRAAGGDTVEPPHVEPRQLPATGRRVLERERGLEQWIARQVALGRQVLHQLLEWNVLVRIGVERPVPNPPQVLDEPGAARQVAAQHQRVHEESDQPLELRPGAAGRWHADRDVVLAAIAKEQNLVGGEQRHEERRPLAPTEHLERPGERFRDFEHDRSAPIARLRRTRPIRRQVQCGQCRQRLPPISQLLFEHRALQPLPLPLREVGVLDRQRRQR